ncbi:unnamed protein product [Meloidogyne enterolobii]|uniref:Uncharacterized protein n=1 Tax=Meloidogyne enterolobii TaxID=390850 RepID=A0ACB0YH65_MELEN
MHNLRNELTDPGRKLDFIYKRLVDFGKFMGRQNYIEFLNPYGIEIDRSLINRGNFPCPTSLHSKRFFGRYFY